MKSVYEFTGTVIGKDKVPYTETFFVVADSDPGALERLCKDNPKTTDFVYTGKSKVCGPDWK